MTASTCPHCGAEMEYDDPHYTRYQCSALVWRDGSTSYLDHDCLKRQLAAKDAEIERLKQAILNEREACAAECRNWWKAEDCEKAIRARGEK
jgi:hypothetical protein